MVVLAVVFGAVDSCDSCNAGGSVKQEFGFINGVDNVNWPPYRDSKS